MKSPDVPRLPRVSIIIPAHNASRFLVRTVESVLAQSFTAWELVIVDDGSADDTYALAQEFERRDARIRAVTQPNLKDAAARNRGFAESDPRTEYVIFLDSDDTWEPRALELLVGRLDQEPDLVAAYGQSAYIDADDQLIRIGELEEEQARRLTFQGRQIVELPPEARTTFAVQALCPVAGRIATPGSVLIRRTALNRAGLFDTDLLHCNDWHLMLRLLNLGDFAFVQDRVLRYRQHSGNKSSRKRTMKQAYLMVRYKMLVDKNLTPENDRIARRAYRYSCVHKMTYAIEALRHGYIRESAKQIVWSQSSYARYCAALVRSRLRRATRANSSAWPSASAPGVMDQAAVKRPG